MSSVTAANSVRSPTGGSLSTAESEEEMSARVFKWVKTRNKYGKYVKIQGITSQPKKKPKKRRLNLNDSTNSNFDDSNESHEVPDDEAEPSAEGDAEVEATSEVVHFLCLTCYVSERIQNTDFIDRKHYETFEGKK